MTRETVIHSHDESYQRLKKLFLDAALLNTQYCKDQSFNERLCKVCFKNRFFNEEKRKEKEFLERNKLKISKHVFLFIFNAILSRLFKAAYFVSLLRVFLSVRAGCLCAHASMV